MIVPGGCTKYIQAPDVVWNKSFKGRIKEFTMIGSQTENANIRMLGIWNQCQEDW